MGPVSGRYLGAVSEPCVETASRPLVRKRVGALGGVRDVLRHIFRTLVMDRIRTTVRDI